MYVYKHTHIHIYICIYAYVFRNIVAKVKLDTLRRKCINFVGGGRLDYLPLT